MIRARILWMVLLGAVAFPAWAQDSRFLSDEGVVSVKDRRDPYTEAVGIGLRAFRFYPGVDIEFRSDDNIFRDNINEESDFITSIKPTAELRSNWSRHRLDMRVNADIAKYADNDSEDYEDYEVGISGRLDIGHDQFFKTSAVYQRRHEDRSDPNDVGGDEPTEIDIFSFTGGFERNVRRINLQTELQYRDIAFDATSFNGVPVDNRDRDRSAVYLTPRLGYEFSPNYEMFVEYQYADVSYDELTNGVQRSSNGHEIIGGTDINISGKAKAQLFAGYQVRNFENSLPDIDIFNFGGEMVWNITGLTSLVAEVDRNVLETTTTGASAFVRTEGQIALEHAFRTNVIAEISFARRDDEYEGTTREDDTTIFNANVTYKPFRGGRVKAGYRFTERDSNVTSASYDANRFYLSLGATY